MSVDVTGVCWGNSNFFIVRKVSFQFLYIKGFFKIYLLFYIFYTEAILC